MSRSSMAKSWLLITALLMAPMLAWSAPRIAVMDFENKSQHGGWRVGRGAADILTTELVKGSDFDIYEREQLNSIIAEQNLGASGRVDPSTAARIGKILGVQYVVTGAVTEYGQSKSGAGGGGVHVGRKGYYATVDVRIVDVNTSRIAFAESGSGSKSSTTVKVFGFGGGESWNEKSATEALRGAVDELVGKLAKADLDLGGGAAQAPKAVLLADVDGNSVILNAGANAGLKSGQTLTIRRKGKEIKDPATGVVLKVKYNTLGTIKLTSVENSYAEATITKGSGFRVGDSAKP
ncbi:CsgG/HfaB family protein [Gilvimarinus sp. F26214L]|uniref:CsgG/HfaB family protein n=1 Tax=Gilvimarinus sp. DZF01 TaxID=3461371 RepID=UPI0040460E5B